MGITEIVKVTISPIEKLIDAVTGAIGKAYQPRHIRKMADAKAYEISRISEELRNNSDLPIVYSGGEANIDTSDFNGILERTGFRLAYQELLKQENIETILDRAYEELEGKVLTSEEPISKDWMNRFVAHAGEISDKDMQIIWGKVLAGEVVAPKTFSLRTLETLTNMSPDEANLFARIVQFVVQGSFLLNDDEFNKKYGVYYSDVLKLEEIGLLNSNGLIIKKIIIGKNPIPIIDFYNYVLIGYCIEKDNDQLSIMEFPLTRTGRELYSIIEKKNKSIEFIKDVAKCIKKQSNGFHITLHKVVSRIDGRIQYDLQEIDF